MKRRQSRSGVGLQLIKRRKNPRMQTRQRQRSPRHQPGHCLRRLRKKKRNLRVSRLQTLSRKNRVFSTNQREEPACLETQRPVLVVFSKSSPQHQPQAPTRTNFPSPSRKAKLCLRRLMRSYPVCKSQLQLACLTRKLFRTRHHQLNRNLESFLSWRRRWKSSDRSHPSIRSSTRVRIPRKKTWSNRQPQCNRPRRIRSFLPQ